MDTPIDLNRERLQAPWRALASREKALDSTPSARIVENASGLKAFCPIWVHIVCNKCYLTHWSMKTHQWLLQQAGGGIFTHW